MSDLPLYLLVGFLAQLVDGAMGMAYGITASTLLLGIGVPPAATSATVHAAECLTTGASALSHHAFGNVNGALFRRLLAPAVAGAILGAVLLSHVPGEAARPYMAGYLLVMGVTLVIKAFREFPSRSVTSHLVPLGFVGAFMDAVGGGGWGPIVATNLLVRGNKVRETVGSVNAVEFFVTLAASGTFVFTLGLAHWTVIAGLALGGLVAAPLGAWACKHLPARPLMVMIGLLVICLSVNTIASHLGTR